MVQQQKGGHMEFLSTRTETRECTLCHETKHINAFMPDKKSAGGRRHQCRSCLNMRRRAMLTPEKNYASIKKYRLRYPLKRRQYELKRRYGITLVQYDQMLVAQNNVCGICDAPTPGTTNGARNFMVDHCHATNQVRGLLCTTCNRGLGNFKDSPDLLNRAILYITSSKGG